jgi:hypothetical protein
MLHLWPVISIPTLTLFKHGSNNWVFYCRKGHVCLTLAKKGGTPMNRIVIVSTAEDSERQALANLLREIFPECTIEIISRKTAGEALPWPEILRPENACLPADFANVL